VEKEMDVEGEWLLRKVPCGRKFHASIHWAHQIFYERMRLTCKNEGCGMELSVVDYDAHISICGYDFFVMRYEIQ
jgi:hypothetical protein